MMVGLSGAYIGMLQVKSMHLVNYHCRSLKGRRNEIFSFLIAGYSVSESFSDLTSISKRYALCSNAASRIKAMLVIRLLFIYQNYFEPEGWTHTFVNSAEDKLFGSFIAKSHCLSTPRIISRRDSRLFETKCERRSYFA
jgi:hypothetical protein